MANFTISSCTYDSVAICELHTRCCTRQRNARWISMGTASHAYVSSACACKCASYASGTCVQVQNGSSATAKVKVIVSKGIYSSDRPATTSCQLGCRLKIEQVSH